MSRTMQDLTRCEILVIWADFQTGVSYRKLVKKYDVTMFTVRKIVDNHLSTATLGGKTWRRTVS